MLLLVLAHFVLAMAAPALFQTLRRKAFVVLALAPASGFLYALFQTPKVFAGESVAQTYQWVGVLQMELGVRLDPLSWLLLLLVGGIGGLVLAYCAAYFSYSAAFLGRFGGVFTAFAGAMVGLVVADDLMLLFIFWELTTVFSYLLIGHYSDKRASRRAATQAITLTTFGGLAMLGGFVILGEQAGTYRISEILANPPGGDLVTVAVICLLVGAISKSALFPFHFWLPAAMAAPTPVSAYLHAAAMVKAGVYLVARFAPAYAHLVSWQLVVLLLGGITFILGGYRALRQTDLKLILAYGTISQLGMLILFVGSGAKAIALAGLTLILAHAVFKAGLFLAVGAIDSATGTRDIRELSGLGRRTPTFAAASAVAVASMAGLPPTLGYVGKEAAIVGILDTINPDSGGSGWTAWVMLTVMILGSAMTLAYGLRFWWGAFAVKRVTKHPKTGERIYQPADTLIHDRHWLLYLPTILLGGLSVLLGLFPGLIEPLLAPHALQSGSGEAGHLALWGGFGPVLWITVGIIALGALLFWQRERFGALQNRIPSPRPADENYRRFMVRLDHFAADVTASTQRGSLSFYLGVIFAVFVLSLGTIIVVSDFFPMPFKLWHTPIEVVLGLIVIVAAIMAARSRRRFKAVLLSGISGYGVALLFLIFGGPDLALTQVLVETITLVVFVLALRRLPVYFSDRPLPASRWIRLAIGVAVGATVSVVAFIAPNARLPEHRPVSDFFAEGAYTFGGGKNIVNVTLVDTRAWDTMGEISVLLVAATGIASMVFVRARSGGIFRSQEFSGDAIPQKWRREATRWGQLQLKTQGGPADNSQDGTMPKQAATTVGDLRARLGSSPEWLRAGNTLAPHLRSVVFEVATRIIFHTMMMYAVYLLLSGHNTPGGGFAGGLIAGIALIVRYLAGGRYELGEAAPFHAGTMLGLGLFLAVGAGITPMFFGGGPLQSAIFEFTLPVFGEVHFVTTLFFDIGVAMVVIGLVLDILRSLGAEIDRHVEQDSEVAETDEAASTGLELAPREVVGASSVDETPPLIGAWRLVRDDEGTGDADD